MDFNNFVKKIIKNKLLKFVFAFTLYLKLKNSQSLFCLAGKRDLNFIVILFSFSFLFSSLKFFPFRLLFLEIFCASRHIQREKLKREDLLFCTIFPP